MASALSLADITEIKAALQIPFQTFVTFECILQKVSAGFGFGKKQREVQEYLLPGYKVESPKEVPTNIGGPIDLKLETLYLNPVELRANGLLNTEGKANIVIGTDKFTYESAVYEVMDVQNVGWFEGEYQLVKVMLKKQQL